uniref:Uncharacterized protein n=1 Tax=Glossina pallidipes TaxID=7398 RepID=A0A1A9Z9C0_GLOPL
MSNRISHATIPATVDFHSEVGTHRNIIVPFLAPGMENLIKRLVYISDLSLPLANDSLSFLTLILGIHASAIPKFFVYVADLHFSSNFFDLPILCEVWYELLPLRCAMPATYASPPIAVLEMQMQEYVQVWSIGENYMWWGARFAEKYNKNHK